tara:strand:+ start:118 stop:372 length:255 start_codon:yes stop_codon:yes gene_type:complete
MADYEKAKQAAAKKAKEDDAATEKDIKSKTNKEQSDLLARMRKGLKEEKGDPGMKEIETAMEGVKAKPLEKESPPPGLKKSQKK